MVTPIPSGSTIGILGGGQLGRYLVMAAHHLGYRTMVLDPDPGCPAGQVGTTLLVGAYDDEGLLARLAEGCQVITYEFENVPTNAIKFLVSRGVPVRPGLKALEVAQNRVQEKTWCRNLGIPTAPFYPVNTYEEFLQVIEDFGCPVLFKTVSGGYDGKGQSLLSDRSQSDAVWADLGAGRVPLIAEGFVAFTMEVAIIVARSLHGDVTYFPLVKTIHDKGILDVTIAPAPATDAIRKTAEDYAGRLANALDLVGILAVEFFVDPDQGLLVNEMAPRPHNSGHYTMEATSVSQFEQQIRAVTGMPLASPRLLHPAAMVNLLGHLWGDSEAVLPLEKAVAVPGAHVYLYGKAAPRIGRKMGHITVVAEPPEVAVERALTARRGVDRSGLKKTPSKPVSDQ